MRYFFFIFLLPAFLVFGGFASAQTVPAPSLSITAPVAGAQLSAGTSVNVAWSLSNAPQGAEVRYLAQFPKDNGGGVVSRIVTTPSYTWAIPTTLPSASYTILVKALVRADGKARIYQGEKVVQVQGSVAGQNTAMGSGSGITPSLSITAPVAGTQLSAGTPVNVAWSLSNAPQGAEVRYLAQFPKDNQGGVISRIVTTPSYVWAIPTTLPSASYTILVKALVRADGKARIYQGEKVVQVQGSAAPVVTRVSPFDFNGDGCVDVGRDLLIFRERTNHCGAPPATCSVAGIEGAKNVLEWTTAFIDAVSAHPCQ